jgi:peptide/nickel transport system ATP-binding protein
MFQESYTSLDPRMRFGTKLREPLTVRGVGDLADQKSRVAQELIEVGLSPRSADKYPREFSGGQRRPIGLAQALILSPKPFIIDEPVTALDVSIEAQLINMMKSLQLSYVVISRDLALEQYLAGRSTVVFVDPTVVRSRSETDHRKVVSFPVTDVGSEYSRLKIVKR